jgi:hypothetical protein
MNEQFKQPVSGFEGRVPEDLQMMARATVEGAREVFSTASEAASKGTERLHHAALANYGVAQRAFLQERLATTVSQTKDLCTLSSNLFQSAAASDR